MRVEHVMDCFGTYWAENNQGSEVSIRTTYPMSKNEEWGGSIYRSWSRWLQRLKNMLLVCPSQGLGCMLSSFWYWGRAPSPSLLQVRRLECRPSFLEINPFITWRHFPQKSTPYGDRTPSLHKARQIIFWRLVGSPAFITLRTASSLPKHLSKRF